jgi:hypothetical protein
MALDFGGTNRVELLREKCISSDGHLRDRGSCCRSSLSQFFPVGWSRNERSVEPGTLSEPRQRVYRTIPGQRSLSGAWLKYRLCRSRARRLRFAFFREASNLTLTRLVQIVFMAVTQARSCLFPQIGLRFNFGGRQHRPPYAHQYSRRANAKPLVGEIVFLPEKPIRIGG